jgi:diaminopimelate epimerase
MSKIEFHKMHGCSNDFVIIDNREYNISFKTEIIKLLSDRNIGIGCDQLIIIDDSIKYDYFMKIYNNDGTEAGNCGNAARCVTKLLIGKKKQITIETNTSILHAKKINDKFQINMGHASFNWRDILTIERIYDDIRLHDELGPGLILSIGNPHIVFFVDNIDDIDIEKMGALIENHPIFINKVNVNFAEIIDEKNIKLKTWERGAGLTLSCGTGACASMIAANKRNLIQNKAVISQKGGNLLIELDNNNEILMTGTADYIFSGEIEINYN